MLLRKAREIKAEEYIQISEIINITSTDVEFFFQNVRNPHHSLNLTELRENFCMRLLDVYQNHGSGGIEIKSSLDGSTIMIHKEAMKVGEGNQQNFEKSYSVPLSKVNLY